MTMNDTHYSNHRGTMQPRQKTNFELQTEALEELRTANSTIEYYTNKKIQAEKMLDELAKDTYPGLDRKTKE